MTKTWMKMKLEQNTVLILRETPKIWICYKKYKSSSRQTALLGYLHYLKVLNLSSKKKKSLIQKSQANQMTAREFKCHRDFWLKEINKEARIFFQSSCITYTLKLLEMVFFPACLKSSVKQYRITSASN